MKKNIKFIMEVIIIGIVTLVMLWYVMDLTERKAADYKYKPFFEEENEIDVMFFGNSHIMNGILPMELWNEYGIVSYNFGGHGNRIPTSYWVLKNVMEYKKPKLVVIDVYMIMNEEKVSPKMEYAHLSFDSFPLSITKINAMQDLFSDDGTRLEFLFNFSLYHNRWEELTQEDFLNQFTVEKGAEAKLEVSKTRKFDLCEKDLVNDSDSTGKNYLCKMIEECQASNIDVMLIHLPHPATKSAQMDANSVQEIANKYNIEYINYMYVEDCINYATDFYDSDSHLNLSGAKKMSTVLGKHIQEKYDIPNHLNDEKYRDWHIDFEEYINYKKDAMKNADSINNMLMLLYNEKYSGCLYVRNDCKLLTNSLFIDLMKNLGVGNQIEDIAGNKDYLLIFSEGNCFEILNLEDVDTNFGVIELLEKDGLKSINLNGQEILALNEDDKIGFVVKDQNNELILTYTD